MRTGRPPFICIGFALVVGLHSAAAQEPKGPQTPQAPLPPAEALTTPPATFGEAAPAGTEAPAGYTPNMLGDANAGACGSFSGPVDVSIGYPGGCAGQNLAEDNSPLPRDRAFIQYNHFNNETHTNIFGVEHDLSIERFTFGVERTFFDGFMSLQLNVPVAQELTFDPSVIHVQGSNNLPFNEHQMHLENIGLASKFLLLRGQALAFSGGLGMTLPTAPDFNVNVFINDTAFPIAGLGRVPVLSSFGGTVKNQAVYLTPFLAALWTPSERLFSQGFLQIAVPLNRDDVQFSGTAQSGGVSGVLPTLVGQFEHQPLLRLNLGVGYWLFQDRDDRFITGMAPTVEVHYTTTLQEANILRSSAAPLVPGGPTSQFAFGNLASRVDVVNLTLGATFLLGERATLATAAVLPLSSGDNQAFDWELNIQFNIRFGPQDRQTRAQF